MRNKQAAHWQCLLYSVLRSLDEEPDISAKSLAAYLGINNAMAHACVATLMARGHLEVRSASTVGGRHGFCYTLTRSGVAFKHALAGRLFCCALVDRDALNSRISTMQTALFRGGLPLAYD